MIGDFALSSLPKIDTINILMILMKSPPAAVPIVNLDTTENPKKFIMPKNESCAILEKNPTQNDKTKHSQNPKTTLFFVKKLTNNMRAMVIFVPVIHVVTILL